MKGLLRGCDPFVTPFESHAVGSLSGYAAYGGIVADGRLAPLPHDGPQPAAGGESKQKDNNPQEDL